MIHVYEITGGRAVGEQSVGGNCLTEQVLNYHEKCSQSSGTGNTGCGAGVNFFLLELPEPGLRHRDRGHGT